MTPYPQRHGTVHIQSSGLERPDPDLADHCPAQPVVLAGQTGIVPVGFGGEHLSDLEQRHRMRTVRDVVTDAVQQTRDHCGPQCALLLPERVIDGEERLFFRIPAHLLQIFGIDEGEMNRLMESQTGQRAPHLTQASLLERQPTRGPGGQCRLEAVVTMHASHFLDEVSRPGQIGSECGNGDRHRIFPHDRHSETLQNPAHIGRVEPGTQQFLHRLDRELDHGGLHRGGDDIHRTFEDLPPGQGRNHGTRPLIGDVGQIRVDTSLESRRRLRYEIVSASHVHDRRRIPGRRLHQNAGGGFRDLAPIPTHGPRHRGRSGVVVDDQVVGCQVPLDVIECHEGLSV